jgi:cyclopropane fatty-acyl-phospholipid synthase-like methyltransferase
VTAEATRRKIAEYYDACEIDYRRIWHLDECLALHIGYWDRQARTLKRALLRQNEVLAESVGVRASDTVLDAGCGVGGSAIFLARRYGCRVTGITLSENQVSAARHHARLHGVDHLASFHVMDFSATQFDAGTFSVVWGLESTCYAESKSAFLREAHRILKERGRLVIADAFESRATYGGADRALLERWLKCWAVDSLESVSGFGRQLEETGFERVSFRDITANVLPSSRRLYLYALITMPLAKLAGLLGLRSDVQTDNVVGAYCQHLALRRGLCKYGIFCAQKD